MSRRTYEQYCGLARALDLLGERWTLLIVRDIALGPKRFTDLLAGLKGLGTSMLSDRLRHLEDIGLVQRTVLDRPGGVVYRLTDDGARLSRALGPLVVWGASQLADYPGADEFRPDWLMYVLESSFRPERADGVDDCYEFRLGAATLFVLVSGGTARITEDEPRPPDFTATLDLPTLAALGNGRTTPREALAAGNASFEGNPDAGARALRIFGP